MEEITRGYVETKHCQLHYYQSGNGQPIILLHPTPNSQFFLKTIPFLSDSYQVFSVDTPGYGNSTRPKVPFSSLEEYANEIVSFIKIKKLKSVILLGHMTGAVTALEAAIQAKKQISNLLEHKPSKEVCLLMSKIEEGDTNDPQKINAWISRSNFGDLNKGGG